MFALVLFYLLSEKGIITNTTSLEQAEILKLTKGSYLDPNYNSEWGVKFMYKFYNAVLESEYE